MEAKAVIFKSEELCRGQGLIEYVLVLAIIVAVAVTVLSAVSTSTSTLVDVMVDNIESVTGVETPAN